MMCVRQAFSWEGHPLRPSGVYTGSVWYKFTFLDEGVFQGRERPHCLFFLPARESERFRGCVRIY